LVDRCKRAASGTSQASFKLPNSHVIVSQTGWIATPTAKLQIKFRDARDPNQRVRTNTLRPGKRKNKPKYRVVQTVVDSDAPLMGSSTSNGIRTASP